MPVPAAGGQQVWAGHRGTCPEQSLGTVMDSPPPSREKLDPWDSEPPGGMFAPGPARLPSQNPSLSYFLLLWMNLKAYKAAEPDL